MFSKSMVWLTLIALVILAATLAVPSLARAGGWVVITLDEVPGNVAAGEPYTVGFMARQHGKTPFQIDEMTITARQPESGKSVVFTAKPEGKPGHYQAELVFPTAGKWDWGIHSGLFPDAQPMPTMTVTDGTVTAGAETSAAAQSGVLSAGLRSSNAWLAAGALLALVAGVVLIARGRARQVPTLAGLGLLVVCGGLVFAFFTSVNAQANAATKPLPVTAAASGAEIGRQVFLAKGCVVCHINARAFEESESYSINFGPNLTVYRNDPEYLRKFLTNPSEVKPATEMPNLNLSLSEVDALITFINAD